MKRFKKIIPLYKDIFANFIDDLIDAVVGFLFGSAIEAILDLDIIKAVIFLMIYVVFSILQNKQNKSKIKVQIKSRGIKDFKKNKLFYIILGGVVIYIILFYGVSLFTLVMLSCVFIRWALHTKDYKLLKVNLISKCIL